MKSAHRILVCRQSQGDPKTILAARTLRSPAPQTPSTCSAGADQAARNCFLWTMLIAGNLRLTLESRWPTIRIWFGFYLQTKDWTGILARRETKSSAMTTGTECKVKANVPKEIGRPSLFVVRASVRVFASITTQQSAAFRLTFDAVQTERSDYCECGCNTDAEAVEFKNKVHIATTKGA